MSRLIKAYAYNDADKFISESINDASTMMTNYGYYFSDICSRTTDINVLLKKKKDWVKHKISIYYDEDEVYTVVYNKSFIQVRVLVDNPKACGIAHKLVKEFKKVKKDIEEV